MLIIKCNKPIYKIFVWNSLQICAIIKQIQIIGKYLVLIKEGMFIMQHDTYYQQIKKLASVICDNIDPQLIAFYNNKVMNTDMYSYFESELQPFFMMHEEINPAITIDLLIVYAIYDLFIESGLDMEQAHKKIMYVSYKKKIYLRNLIYDEAKGSTTKKNPTSFLKRSYEALQVAKDTNMDLSLDFNTYDEYVDYRLKRLNLWYSKNSTPFRYILEFDFFTYLSLKRQAGYFITDLATNALSIINDKFYGNPESGFLTKFPQDLMNMPIFSLSAYKAELTYEIQDDKMLVYEIHNAAPGTQVRVVMASIPGNFRNLSEEEKSAQIQKIKSNPEFALNTLKGLDSKDFAILANIYSHLNGININDDSFRAKCSTFMANIYQPIAANTYRSRDYEDFISRLRKLSTYNLDKVTYDKNKTLVNTSSVNFLNYELTIPQNEELEGDETETTFIISSAGSYAPNINFSNLNRKQLQKAELEIIPSKYMKDQWRTSANAEIYTKYYNQIETNKGKTLIHILQGLRLQSLDTLACEKPLSYFKQKLYTKSRPARLLDDLRTEFDLLIEANTILQEYTINKGYTISLKFLPLSKVEKQIYNLSGTTLIEDDTVPSMKDLIVEENL